MSITYPLTIPVTATKTQLTAVTTVGEARSPITQTSQLYQWQGEYWGLALSFKPLKRAQAAQLQAFLVSLRGKSGTFLAGDPSAKTPRGIATGTPRTTGSSSGFNVAGATSLKTNGWTASQAGILKAGDYIQVTSSGGGMLFGPQRLYVSLTDQNSDSDGVAIFDIFPRLRETLTDNLSIVTASTKGTFRLDGNKVQWDIEWFLAASFSLLAVEAI